MVRQLSTSRKNNIPYQQVQYLIQLLDRTSLPCYWEQAVLCPCLDPVTKQPRSNCPHCHGRGVLYRSPVEIPIALQNNAKDAYNGQDGTYDRGTVLATPQISENAIENGISYRDRITVKDATLTQSYIVSITSDRINRGIRMPYDVTKIDHIETFVNDSLMELSDNQYVFDYDRNLLVVTDSNLAGSNVTLTLSVKLRYYVSDILKEYRNAQIAKKQTETKVLNIPADGASSYNDGREPLYDDMAKQKSYRMPKKLILKREDFFIPVGDLTTESPLVANIKSNAPESLASAFSSASVATSQSTTKSPETTSDNGIIESGHGKFVDTRDMGDDISYLWGD